HHTQTRTGVGFGTSGRSARRASPPVLGLARRAHRPRQPPPHHRHHRLEHPHRTNPLRRLRVVGRDRHHPRTSPTTRLRRPNMPPPHRTHRRNPRPRTHRPHRHPSPIQSTT